MSQKRHRTVPLSYSIGFLTGVEICHYAVKFCFLRSRRFFLVALCAGGHGNPPDSGTLLSAYADISPYRGITRPYGVSAEYKIST